VGALKRGDKGARVRALQRALVALGYPLRQYGVDGDFGDETLAAAQLWLDAVAAGCRSHGIVPAWLAQAVPAVAGKAETAAQLADTAAHDTQTIGTLADWAVESIVAHRAPISDPAAGIRRAGAWVGRKGLHRPEKYASRALSLGLTDVSLFVTGIEHTHFELLASSEDIAAAVREYQIRGLRVHLSTWVRPSSVFLTELARVLVPLCNLLDIASLDLDTEGAWKRGRGHEEHAAYLFAQLRDLSCPVGVNDYASLQPVTRPLIERCSIIRPQLYSVAYVKHGNVGADGKKWTKPGSVYWPGKTQRYGMAEKLWGGVRAGKQLEIGLAAYKQPVRGWSTDRAMTTCWDAAEELGAQAVWWWSLGHMRGDIAQAVRKLTGRLP
jgi:hypothetical protein